VHLTLLDKSFSSAAGPEKRTCNEIRNIETIHYALTAGVVKKIPKLPCWHVADFHRLKARSLTPLADLR